MNPRDWIKYTLISLWYEPMDIGYSKDYIKVKLLGKAKKKPKIYFKILLFALMLESLHYGIY